jgi:hypothetical protein
LTAYYNNTDALFDANGYNPDNFTSVNVTYSWDTFTFGSTTLPQMAFDSSITLCYGDDGCEPDPEIEPYYFLAMGVSSNQAALWSNSNANGAQFPTLIQQMKTMDVIKTRSYSIWVDDPVVQTGHILLGGINSKRYLGNLTVLNAPYTSSVVEETPHAFFQDAMNELKISLVSLGVSNGASSRSGSIPPVPVVLLPYYITTVSPTAAKFIWDAVGATYDTTVPLANLSSQLPTVPCSYLSNSSTLDLKFDGAPNLTVSVPMSDLTIHNGTGPDFDQGPYGSNCQLLVQAWSNESAGAYLSTSIMKHIYTVIDFENNVISIALTDFNSTEDNIIEIPLGGVAAIPASAFGTPTSTTSSSGTSSPKKHVNAVAIGVGVAIPLAVISCALLGFVFWKRKKSESSQQPQMPEIQPSQLGTNQWRQEVPAVEHRKSELPAYPERALSPDQTHVAYSAPSDVDKIIHENTHELPSPHQT